jgi:hypothetical protein
MNSLRSFVRQSISLGSNAFQEKDKADKRQHEGSSLEGSKCKISAEDNASTSGLTDVEVVEDQRRQGEFLDCRIEILRFVDVEVVSGIYERGIAEWF